MLTLQEDKIVNTLDLLSFLKKNKQACAALDVVDPKYENLCWNFSKKFNNLILTPHIAGLTKEFIELTDLYLINKFLLWYKRKNDQNKFYSRTLQNHNGSVNRLLDMVSKCADNGADIIKMQSIYVDDLTFRPIFESGYQINKRTYFIKRDYKSEYKRLKKLEINYKDTEKFIKKCLSKNVIPMTTCFSRNRVNDLYNLGFKHIKVASYDCGSFQLIKELSDKFKNLIISTGATYDPEIMKTNNLLSKKLIILFSIV